MTAPVEFALHPKLAADCEPLGELPLCVALLMRDDRFPWVILVPRLPRLGDLHDLPAASAPALFAEVGLISRALKAEFKVRKINVAALGNQVPQLHVHVIGRHPEDAAWPQPVWNAGPGSASAAVQAERAAVLRGHIASARS